MGARAALALVVLTGGCDAVLRLDRVPDPPKGTIRWEGTFVTTNDHTPGDSHTFSATAQNVGDAIVIQSACINDAVPTMVTIDAPGWSFVPTSSLSGHGAEWVSWSADEECVQAGASDDVLIPFDATPWCQLTANQH